jgi:predicted RNase H-like HicB family nuclease
MQIPVLIEPVQNNGYRATTGLPLVVSAQGATREEALLHLQQALQTRLSNGTELTAVEVATEHPLARFAGMFKDNPLFDEWQQAIAEYRQQVEDDPER